MKKLLIVLLLTFALTNCSSTTKCNGKTYRAGAGELSFWCAFK